MINETITIIYRRGDEYCKIEQQDPGYSAVAIRTI